MQYMASITFDPAHQAEIVRTVPAEQARVRELQQQGVLQGLYVAEAPGAPGKVWAVFNGDSPAAVHQTLESLPLYPYMHVELTPLRALEARV